MSIYEIKQNFEKNRNYENLPPKEECKLSVCAIGGAQTGSPHSG